MPLGDSYSGETQDTNSLVSNPFETLHYVQSLRVFLIVLVIAHHAGKPMDRLVVIGQSMIRPLRLGWDHSLR